MVIMRTLSNSLITLFSLVTYFTVEICQYLYIYLKVVKLYVMSYIN